MVSDIPKLSIRVSNSKGKKTYHFECKEIIVGRSKEATLRIPVNGMSRLPIGVNVSPEKSKCAINL